VGKLEGRRPVGRPRHRWGDNIKIGLNEMQWEHGSVRSGSEQELFTGSCEYGNEPSGFMKCREFFEQVKAC
jgi:hypothetical protein